MDLAHSVAHHDEPSPTLPIAITQQSKQGALASVVQFLIEQAVVLHPISSPSSSPGLTLLRAYNGLVQSSQLQSLEIGELEGIVGNLIEHQLVGWYTLNAFSLVHFHRMARRREEETWSSQGKEKAQAALKSAQEAESPASAHHTR
jgi:hypothetical protein